MDLLDLAPNARHLRAVVNDLVDTIESIDTSPETTLSDHDLRHTVMRLERAINSASAAQAVALVEMGSRARTHDVATAGGNAGGHDPETSVLVSEEFIPDEISLLLHCSTAAAHARYHTALDAARTPAAPLLWRAGVIDARKVQVIADELTPLDPRANTTHELAADAADYATTHTPTQTRAWLARRVIAADPHAASERCRRASADRRVVFTPGVDSMASIWAHLPGVQARQVFDTVDAVAKAAEADDVRTMDQRRADALIDLVTGRAEPPRVDLQVVVSAESLSGQSDSPA